VTWATQTRDRLIQHTAENALAASEKLSDESRHCCIAWSSELWTSDVIFASSREQLKSRISRRVVLADFLPRFHSQIWVSDVTFVTFSGDKKM